MLYKILFILFVLNYLVIIQTAKRPLIMEIHRVDWTDLSSPFKNASAKMTKLAVNRYSLDLWFELDRQLNANAEAEIIINARALKGRKNMKFMDVKINICDFMMNVDSLLLIRELYIELIRNSNLPYSCPIKGNFRYNITNFILTDALFPAYVPSLYFNYTLNYYENQKVIARYLTEGSITRE